MVEGAELKACCAAMYEQDWVKLLLGDSYHPGGLDLTRRLGELLELGPGMRVLDVASGQGTSAFFLAETFGCEVVGADLGREMVEQANRRASDLVSFEVGDSEDLPFPDGAFDAVICECAYCTFPDKARAAREFRRVLRPGGRVGISDLTRTGPLPEELETLLAWVSCIADALPASEYVEHFRQAGFASTRIERHDSALSKMVSEIRARLTGVDLLVKLKKVELPGVDLERAQQIARTAAQSIQEGKLGYAIVIGSLP